MQITGNNGHVLKVDIDSGSAFFIVSINNGPVVLLDLVKINQLLPSLAESKVALEEATKAKEKQRIEDIKAKIVDLQNELAELQKTNK